MEGRAQLPASEVLEGRKIASVRIHVERAINRIKTFSILKTSLPITFSRMANQIACVCGWLVNFQSVLLKSKMKKMWIGTFSPSIQMKTVSVKRKIFS